jgi:hypothetical protein
MSIIGLVGNKRVGKDTCADYLVSQGYIKLSFAHFLKESLKVLFDWDDESFNDDNKEKNDVYWGVSPRYMCQSLGTFLRNNIITDKSFHIKRLDKVVKSLYGLNIVFSDIRYQDELDYVKSLGGIIIKITRNSVQLNEYSNHQSETGIDKLINYDYHIKNNSTKEELFNELIKLLNDQ